MGLFTSLSGVGTQKVRGISSNVLLIFVSGFLSAVSICNRQSVYLPPFPINTGVSQLRPPMSVTDSILQPNTRSRSASIPVALNEISSKSRSRATPRPRVPYILSRGCLTQLPSSFLQPHRKKTRFCNLNLGFEISPPVDEALVSHSRRQWQREETLSWSACQRLPVWKVARQMEGRVVMPCLVSTRADWLMRERDHFITLIRLLSEHLMRSWGGWGDSHHVMRGCLILRSNAMDVLFRLPYIMS